MTFRNDNVSHLLTQRDAFSYNELRLFSRNANIWYFKLETVLSGVHHTCATSNVNIKYMYTLFKHVSVDCMPLFARSTSIDYKRC